MAIITTAEAKTLLGITDASQDALIATLIPQVEADFLVIRNREFDTKINGERLGVGDGINKTFTIQHVPIIADSEQLYIAGYATSEEYTINNVTGVITFANAPADGVRITADYESQDSVYPDNGKFVAAKMIGWHLQTQKSLGANSESLGDHSIAYSGDDTYIKGYPKSIVGAIKRYASFA
jgi:hypothetical protein